MKKGIEERSANAFHMLMNFWGDTLYPVTLGYFLVVYGMIFFVDEKSLIYNLLCDMWFEQWKFLLLSVLVFGNIFVILAGLYNDKKLDRKVLKNFFGFVIYLVTWIPIGIWGIVKKDEKEWFHTPHSGGKS